MPISYDVPVSDDESVVAVHHPGTSEEWFVCCHAS